MVDGIFQEQDAVFDGVADVVLRVGGGGGHLLVGAAFCQFLMLQTKKKVRGRGGADTLWSDTQLQQRSDLDENFPLQLVGGGQAVRSHVHCFGQQHVSKHLLKVGGHVPLLHDAAVVLDGQDDGEAGGGGIRVLVLVWGQVRS